MWHVPHTLQQGTRHHSHTPIVHTWEVQGSRAATIQLEMPDDSTESTQDLWEGAIDPGAWIVCGGN